MAQKYIKTQNNNSYSNAYGKYYGFTVVPLADLFLNT